MTMRNLNAPVFTNRQSFSKKENDDAPDTTAFEHHFTPHELADLWKLDESTIRRMFVDEPGVLLYGEEDRRDGLRDYMTVRIPQSVAMRVHERRSGGAS